jgi:NAD(P)-dependent dehydrogenase (short-subunit alcohol dehydrogenase family)
MAGKVVVVTGGASGIGRAMSERFVQEGAFVVVADVQEEVGQAVVEGFGDAGRFVATDVSKEAAVAAAVDLAVTTWGRLDCMCNNAGLVGAVGPIAETEADDWDRTVAVLLRSVFLGTKHAARVMLPQRSGVILNTTSIAGVIGGLGPHAYTACKHGVVGLTKSASAELWPSGIRVNAIAPGSTATALTAPLFGSSDVAAAERALAARDPRGLALVAGDIAEAGLFLVSDEARHVSGHTLVVDDGRSVNGGSARFSGAAAGFEGEPRSSLPNRPVN